MGGRRRRRGPGSQIAVGSKVSRGDVIALPTAARSSSAGCRPGRQADAAAAPAAASVAASHSGAADIECDVLQVQAGPGGYSAAFRAADLGLKVVLVEALQHAGRRGA